MKKSKLVSVRLPNYLIDCVDTLSSKYKYLTMSNIIKLGIMSVMEDYGVSYESNKTRVQY